MFSLEINSERLTLLAKKADAIGRTDGMMRQAGDAVEGFLVSHFMDLAEERHHSNAKVNFYARAAKSVRRETTTPASVIISINKLGLLQRLKGGLIAAGRGISSKTGELTRLVAISTDETYGKTPGEEALEQDMAFVPTKLGGALVQGMMTTITRGPNRGKTTTRPLAGGLVLYWLKPEVTQEPDDSVLPSQLAIAGCAGDAAEDFLNHNLKN